MKKHKRQRIVHKPVLLEEVIDALGLKVALLKTQVKVIDATLGNAGHSIEIIKHGALVLGIDADKKMIDIARDRLQEACPSLDDLVQRPFKLVLGNFRDIDKIAQENDFNNVNGILFDLGVSNVHFASISRGFSFKKRSAKFDMRLDPKKQQVKASDLIEKLRPDQLTKLFEATMSKGEVSRLVRRIIETRERKEIKTVGDFLDICERVLTKKTKIHPATKAFLALRMAVNSELENLSEVLPKAFKLLDKNGRLLVISFHSGEDKIVKDYFRRIIKEGKAIAINQKPIVPENHEIKINPKARSAKLRIIEKNEEIINKYKKIW